MKKNIFLVGLSILFSLSLFSFGPVYAQTGVVKIIIPDEQANATEAYWTRERELNAKPYPLPALQGVPNTGTSAPLPFKTGVPGAVKGGDAENAESSLEEALVSTPFPTATEPVPMTAYYSYPPPHITYPLLASVGWYLKFPHKTVGKVYLTQNGINYVCSGSSIGGRAVLTAGHCVNSGADVWSTNVLFKPAYPNFPSGFDSWPGKSLYTFAVWANNKDYCRDVGFIITKFVGGWKLSALVSWLGFAWNFSMPQAWTQIGYPAESPFTGNQMVFTHASFSALANDRFSLSCYDTTASQPVGHGTTQTPGTSGGPWILQYEPGQGGSANYANGLSSFTWSGYPYEIFSPYFDTTVYNVYTDVITY